MVCNFNVDLCNSKYLGYIDADLQTSPNDFHILLKYIDNYDLVTGNRSNRKDTYLKNISSLVANGIRNIFTSDGVNDTGCPLKVIKTDYAKKIPMFKGLHRFLPAMILLQNIMATEASNMVLESIILNLQISLSQAVHSGLAFQN